MKRSRSSTPADALALSFPAPQLISVQAISGNNKSHQALQQLRRSELFACVSAWLGLFGEEFGVVEYQPALLEQDLDGRYPNSYAPFVAWKLAQAMVVKDKSIQQDNFMSKIRREFAKRSPEASPVGDVDGSDQKEWHQLSMFDKVFVLYSLTQWHFADAQKFRDILGPVSDEVDWRIRPIGEDADENSYWLFDDNRLWKQSLATRAKSNGSKAAANKRRKPNAKAKPAAAEPDSSDLSDLSDVESGSSVGSKRKGSAAMNSSDQYAWEAVCVHLEDWEAFVQQFKGTKNADEKALCRHINQDVLPAIRADFEAQQELLAKQARAQKKADKLSHNLMYRKKSSRLAEKESEVSEQKRQQMVQEDLIDELTATRAPRGSRTAGAKGAQSQAEPPMDRETRTRLRQERMQHMQDEQAIEEQDESGADEAQDAQEDHGDQRDTRSFSVEIEQS